MQEFRMARCQEDMFNMLQIFFLFRDVFIVPYNAHDKQVVWGFIYDIEYVLIFSVIDFLRSAQSLLQIILYLISILEEKN